LWPKGFDAPFDVMSAVIAVAAAIALFKYKRNVMHVIAVCGLLGIGLQYGLK
jgi:chromate transporter